jgi:hypothetical protein
VKNNIFAISLCAIVLFFWGFVSWAVLPWHDMVANKFTSESSVSQVLKQNAPTAGVYYLPFAEEDHKPGETAAFVNVLPDGFEMNMGKLMGRAMLGQLTAALLVLLLLRKTSNLNYRERVRFVALVGVVIGFVSHFPYWNWFGFSTSYVLITIIDSLIAWSLAGLVMAKFVVGKPA